MRETRLGSQCLLRTCWSFFRRELLKAIPEAEFPDQITPEQLRIWKTKLVRILNLKITRNYTTSTKWRSTWQSVITHLVQGRKKKTAKVESPLEKESRKLKEELSQRAEENTVLSQKVGRGLRTITAQCEEIKSLKENNKLLVESLKQNQEIQISW
ncbi:unnamed protein product [Mytilus edulis]|uniref:Uncharacterized protein n=1 Tax=Mytilus edulis TaxID=6550 RepID=A0A8S3V1B6_MYTED|nr:unnamed protein product [Mytilus edulis]